MDLSVNHATVLSPALTYQPDSAVNCGGLAERRALDLEAHAAVDHDIDPRVLGCEHLEVRDVASSLRSSGVILRFPLVLVAHRRLADDNLSVQVAA